MDDIVTDKNGIKYRLLSRHDLIGRLLKLHGEYSGPRFQDSGLSCALS